MDLDGNDVDEGFSFLIDDDVSACSSVLLPFGNPVSVESVVAVIIDEDGTFSPSPEPIPLFSSSPWCMDDEGVVLVDDEMNRPRYTLGFN